MMSEIQNCSFKDGMGQWQDMSFECFLERHFDGRSDQDTHSLSPFDSRLPIKWKLYIYNRIIANKQIGVWGKDATLKQTWESWQLIQGEYFVIVFKVSQNNFKELVKENDGTRKMVQPGKHLPHLQSSCVWTYSTYVRKDECNMMCLSFRYGGDRESCISGTCWSPSLYFLSFRSSWKHCLKK